MRRRGSARPSRWATLARETDERLVVAGAVRRRLNRVVPQSRSFLLGELTLYSLVVLLVTGVFLTFFFTPSESPVTYDGSYLPLRGLSVSEAYASTLRLSFDVRGGLLIRQMHHWAALLFLVTMIMHMFRVLFTGAFRKPREITYVTGVLLVAVSLGTGFSGYNLTDDIIGGSSLAIAWSILLSIPVVGTWLAFAFFGGEYPGTEVLQRLYVLHVFVLPGVLVLLLTVHLALVVRHGHAQFPGPGRSERRLVGRRSFPASMARSGGLLAMVAGLLAALGGLVQVQPVWLYGPHETGDVTSFSQPDWYMFFLEGALRLSPPWDVPIGPYTIPQLFWPAIALPTALFGAALVYPWVEALVTRDHRRHSLLQRPRDAPLRTGVVAAALSFWGVLTIGAMDDAVAFFFDTSVELVVRVLRTALFVVPVVTLLLTRRLCLELQQRDRDLLEQGAGTPLATYLGHDTYAEVTLPRPVADRDPVARETGPPLSPAGGDGRREVPGGDGHPDEPRSSLLGRVRGAVPARWLPRERRREEAGRRG